MSLKSTLLATAVAGASLLAAGSAQAATGHACKTNTGASGCTAANLVAAGALTAADVGTAAADDFTFVGTNATLRCTVASGAGQITSNGGTGAVGTGVTGYLSSLTLNNGGSGACTGTLAGVAVTGTVTVNDSNGASLGLVNVVGDWLAGSPKVTLQNLSVTATLLASGSPYATCNLSATSYQGTPNANASGRVNFSGTLTKVVAGSTGICPASGTATVPVNFQSAGAAVFLTA
jgi:hypothetical protein